MKKIVYLIFIFNWATTNSTYCQTVADIKIPRKYKIQFEKDQKRYLDYMQPLDSAAGATFNFWRNVRDGYLKNYNQDSLYTEYKKLQLQTMKASLEFIKQNPASYASLFYLNLSILNSSLFTPDSLWKIYSILSPQLQSTILGKNTNQSIGRKQSLLLNHEMPIFSFKTDNGKQLNLSTFRGKKNVLLCFWASWCRPCIENIPLLKKIEESYKEKGLQLISVSIDDDSSRWLNAVKKYSMPWLQTCDLPAFTKQRLRTLYEIHFIPQYFLIDIEGKLIYQNVLSGDMEDYSGLETTLHNFLGAN